MKVEITIRVLGEENETAETLLGRVASLLRDQPSVLLETVGAKGETIAVKASREAEEDEDEAAPADKPAKKRGRKSNAEKAAMAETVEKPSKKKKAEPEPEEDEEFEDDIDELEDGEEGDEDEVDEEPEEKPAKGKGKTKDKKGAGLTLEGDIIPAFRKFTGQHGNSAGAEVMKQFGVQSVRDLDDSDYPKVIEAIASYKPKKKK